MTRLDYRTLLGSLLIWLCVILAGLIGAYFSTGSITDLLPGTILLAVPAVLSLLFLPKIDRFWAQAILLLIWLGFGIISTLVAGFIPAAISFLMMPAIGMLFAKERVIEGLILAAIGLSGSFLALSYAALGASPLNEAEQQFVSILSVAATLAFTVAAMIGGTHRRIVRSDEENEPAETNTADPEFARRPDAIWSDGLAGAIFEFATDGKLLTLNERARPLFGLDDPVSEMSLTQIANKTSDPDAVNEAAHHAWHGKQTVMTRAEVNPNPLARIAVDMRFSPVSDKSLLLHVIERSEDAQEIIDLEDALHAAKADANDKTLFFAGVSHELRTPLNAIIGFSDMMKSRLFGPLPGKYAEYADLIHESGQYMLDLIGDVLDLSKVEVGKYQLTLDNFDVSDVVRSSVKMVRPAADVSDVRLDVILPNDEPLLITADRKALRQILLNLLSNAIKFSPKGSRVTVHTVEHDEQIIIAVRDRGPGMSRAEIDRIGRPFEQGKSAQDSEARGSGLGLSLVRSLAALHGGTLTIESESGKGTNAKVTLPMKALQEG